MGRPSPGSRHAVQFAAVALAAACGGGMASPLQDDDVTVFTLISLDSSALPARINDGLYVFSGRLRLFNNGVFAEGLTRNSGVRSPTGFQEASGSREEATTGTWSTLGDGRIELRYADRVPFVFDTATTIDDSLSARCTGYLWCGSVRTTVWARH